MDGIVYFNATQPVQSSGRSRARAIQKPLVKGLLSMVDYRLRYRLKSVFIQLNHAHHHSSAHIACAKSAIQSQFPIVIAFELKMLNISLVSIEVLPVSVGVYSEDVSLQNGVSFVWYNHLFRKL